jgi:hypothetical protein
MKSILAAVAVVLLLGSTAYGQWYVGPRAVYYPAAVYAYPAPVYAYPAPVYAYPAPYYSYRVPVAYPYVAYSPVVAAPAVVPAAVWYGPPGVVVRSKVYIPGRPVRNVVRAVVP